MDDALDRTSRPLAVTRYLRAATRTATKLTEVLDLRHVVDIAVSSLVTDFDAALARVWLCDRVTRSFELVASAGLSVEAAHGAAAPVDRAVYPHDVGETARARQPVFKNSLVGDPEFDQAWVARAGVVSAAVFPLVTVGELRGVVAAFFPSRLEPEVIDVLTTLGAMVATALHGAQLYVAAETQQHRLQSVLTQAPAAFAILRGPDHVYELSNPANDRLVGRAVPVGKPVREALPEAVPQGFVALLDQVYQTGEAVAGSEVPGRIAPGGGSPPREVYLNAIYQPLCDADGQVEGVLSFAYEVTEQVRARQRAEALSEDLRRSEARARRLQDSGVIGVVYWTRAGELVDANEAFLRMVGYTREELSAGAVQWREMTPPEFAHLDERAFAQMESTGFCQPYEKEYFAKDGRRVPILLGVAYWEGSTTDGVAWIVDLSEQRRAEDALKMQARVLQSMAEGVSLSDEKGVILFTNDAEDAMFGYERGELVGQHVSVQNTYPPEENLRIVHAVIAELKARGVWTGEFRNVKKDGTPFVTRARITAVELSGRPHWVCVQADVTQEARDAMEKARAYADAAAAERRFRSLVTATTQIVWTTAANGSTPEDSPTWRAFTGQTLEQWQGGGVLEAVHPDDRAQTVAASRRARTERSLMTIECRVRRHDGVYRDMVVRGVPVLNDDGSVRDWVGTTTDVTDQKRAEFALRFLAEAGTTLASSLNPAETLKNVGRLAVPVFADWLAVHLCDSGRPVELASVTHADPAKEALLRALFERYGVAADPPHGYSRVMRTGEPELIAAFDDAARAGVTRDPEHRAMLDELHAVSAITVPLRVARRTFGAISLVASASGRRYDTADLQLAEELARRVAVALDNARLFEMAQSERTSAEEANRAKDLFLSTLSHELRTPLNAILGWTRMIQAGAVSEEKRDKALATIDRNAQAQAALIDDILDLSRVVTGKLKLEIVPVEIAQIVEAALDTVRPAADARGVRLQPVLDPGAGAVMGDPNRLQQVVWNLLSNAIKFTPRGGRVHVRVQRMDSHVEVLVADTGEGIDPAFLPHVWERFKQADASSTRRHGGLGLGLAIVKHLVEMHGGSVLVDSEGQGRGAAFTIRIPIVTVLGSLPTRPSGSPPAIGRARDFECPPELSGLAVLVLDDEQDARELVASVLEHCRAVVTMVSNAADALDAVRRGTYDVLVSDIGMPGEDGLALIKKIRALPESEGGRIPAVALTAYARLEDRARSMVAGFDNHVGKPVDVQELVAVVANLAGRFSKS